jgi:hypothetical protein
MGEFSTYLPSQLSGLSRKSGGGVDRHTKLTNMITGSFTFPTPARTPSVHSKRHRKLASRHDNDPIHPRALYPCYLRLAFREHITAAMNGLLEISRQNNPETHP